MWQSTGNKA